MEVENGKIENWYEAQRFTKDEFAGRARRDEEVGSILLSFTDRIIRNTTGDNKEEAGFADCHLWGL